MAATNSWETPKRSIKNPFIQTRGNSFFMGNGELTLFDSPNITRNASQQTFQQKTGVRGHRNSKSTKAKKTASSPNEANILFDSLQNKNPRATAAKTNNNKPIANAKNVPAIVRTQQSIVSDPLVNKQTNNKRKSTEAITGSTQKKRKMIQKPNEYPFYVEEVLGRRERSHCVEYLIKWVGYSHLYNSWEPVESFAYPAAVLALYKP